MNFGPWYAGIVKLAFPSIAPVTKSTVGWELDLKKKVFYVLECAFLLQLKKP